VTCGSDEVALRGARYRGGGLDPAGRALRRGLETFAASGTRLLVSPAAATGAWGGVAEVGVQCESMAAMACQIVCCHLSLTPRLFQTSECSRKDSGAVTGCPGTECELYGSRSISPFRGRPEGAKRVRPVLPFSGSESSKTDARFNPSGSLFSGSIFPCGGAAGSMARACAVLVRRRVPNPS
jgi:hypothetical protein